MPQLPVKVSKVTTEQGFGPQGRAVETIRVEFMVGDHGPFVERFTKEEFNGGNVNARLNAFAQQLNLVQGVNG